MLGSQSLQTLCRFPSGDNVTGQWQGDGEERKELRFILELEPIGHADASWKEDQGEKSKETSSPWGRKEPGTTERLSLSCFKKPLLRICSLSGNLRQFITDIFPKIPTL